MDDWANTFYSWDLVDQVCINLLRFIPQARGNIFVWCESEDEFVKRTAFSLIAVLAVHEKQSDFEIYFDILKEGSLDDRNKKALKLSYEILEMDSKSSKWVARGAIKELES